MILDIINVGPHPFIIRSFQSIYMYMYNTVKDYQTEGYRFYVTRNDMKMILFTVFR